MPQHLPEWFATRAVCWLRLPEPEYLLKLKGGQPLELSQQYAEAYAPEKLSTLKEQGYTGIQLPYFFGFGKKVEAKHQERVTYLAQAAIATDLSVVLEIALGPIYLETFLAEEPEAWDWLALDRQGQPLMVDAGDPRVLATLGSEAYLRYLEKVALAALETGASGIVYSLHVNPMGSLGPLDAAHFRQFLRDAYGPQNSETRSAGEARFGFNTFSRYFLPWLKNGVWLTFA
jgi:hypothetical protein